MPQIFFGYPARPKSQGEVLRLTAAALGDQFDGVEGVTWEDLQVGGRLVIQRVLDAIDVAEMCVFDITHPNENVLFEVGYAIARGKRVWLTQDTTVETARSAWNDLGILKPIGYVSYRNSADLVARFVSEDPLSRLEPIYDDLIEPVLPELSEPRQALLYCPTFAQFEAASRLSKLVDDHRARGLSVFVSDPQESGLNPITWYAPTILKSAGVLVHFAGKSRMRATTHNRRHALVAGLAVGFDTPVLMLAEEDYDAPFDYETRLHKYSLSQECVAVARTWVQELSFDEISWVAPRRLLRSALSGLRFGEHVAENELGELPDYFVETAAYGEVVAARDAIFIGHRGTGKTANATQAFDHIQANKTNLAVLIKPPGFEFPALMAVVSKLPASQHDYFFDALWRFLIQTEIAATVYRQLTERSANVPLSAADQRFVQYVESASFDMRADISVRLEQAFDYLLTMVEDTVAEKTRRDLINEAFHAHALAELRHELGPVLKDKKRVAVFVDNLDKGWERGADFKIMARFILGVLTARGRVVVDFAKQDFWRDEIKLTVAIFLRSDIYNYLRQEAREPDKLPISTITWRDPETLMAVIESRFLFASKSNENADELWSGYFCPKVNGTSTREYVTRTVLPRPRDLVYFCNAAVGMAIDRGHGKVEEADFISAEETYSQYAYEALLVENGVTIPEMEDGLFAFLNSSDVLTIDEILQQLQEAGLYDDRGKVIMEKLIAMFFLGRETAEGIFTFPEVGTEAKKAAALAARLQPDQGLQRLQVHPAFHRFLGIHGADPS